MNIQKFDGTSCINDLGSGDSYIIPNFFTKEESDRLFDQSFAETNWETFTIKKGVVPRLISVQADINGDTCPLYRHPVDFHPKTIPWTIPSKIIKDYLEEMTDSKYNHALVQLYSDGKAFISPHSDKTLDIKHGTSIANVSLGETRTLILKSKDKTKKQEIKLLSGSLYVLGWKTNSEWIHSIQRNGDPGINVEPRISLTFRNIATHMITIPVICGYNIQEIYGQGAIHKTPNDIALKYFIWAKIMLICTLLIMYGVFTEDNPFITPMIITGIIFAIKKYRDHKQDALSMQHLFADMNKKTDPSVFTSSKGHNAITYIE